MSLGYLFKKYRKLNGLTQKTLGEITNLDDVRIRQYESDLRTPKENVLKTICKALNIKSEYINHPSLPYTREDVIRFLFKTEDFIPVDINQVDIDGTKVNSISFLGPNILKIDQTLSSWQAMKNKYRNNEITQKQYEDWKANWPDSMADDYKLNSFKIDKY